MLPPITCSSRGLTLTDRQADRQTDTWLTLYIPAGVSAHAHTLTSTPTPTVHRTPVTSRSSLVAALRPHDTQAHRKQRACSQERRKEFHWGINQTVFIRQKAWADKCANQLPIYMYPALYICLSLYFPTFIQFFFSRNAIMKNINTRICEHLRTEMEIFAPDPQQNASHPNSCSFPQI